MKRLWQKLMCKLGHHDYYVHEWTTRESLPYEDISFQTYRLTITHYRVECRACPWTERTD